MMYPSSPSSPCRSFQLAVLGLVSAAACAGPGDPAAQRTSPDAQRSEPEPPRSRATAEHSAEASSALASPVDLSRISTLYLIGDSLTDQQNIFTSIPAVIWCPNPAYGYWNGRFTNGRNWVDFLQEDYPNLKVVNLAVGGSKVLKSDWFRPSLREQADKIQGDLSNAMVFIWSGANDLNEIAREVNASTPATAAEDLGFQLEAEISSIASNLTARGMAHIVVGELPPLQLVPVVRTPEFTDATNGAIRRGFLATAVASVNRHLNIVMPPKGIPLYKADSFIQNFIRGVTPDPYMTDVTDACQVRGSKNACDLTFFHSYIEQPCEHKMFMDQLHPTSYAHCGLKGLFDTTLANSGYTGIQRGRSCIQRELRPGQFDGHPNADPSVIRVDTTYYSVESADGRIYVRMTSIPEDITSAARVPIWIDPGIGEIWAPELVRIGGRYYVYFSGGPGPAHRMYVISSDSPASGYGAAQKLALPDDKWAVDGTAFNFNNQLWFVWSGWAGDTNVEQNLYIARMANPTTPTGGRFIISQAREGWERVVGNPFINEGPEAIKDPNGQLHIVYSANGSWSDQYCLADLRLRAGGDPTYVWDWYKSNGCLFGSNPGTMMPGFSTTQAVNGPGHHSFVLLDGDINTSPPAGLKFPLMYHAVQKGVTYNWGNRRWFYGSFGFWPNITYSRSNVPGDNLNTGYSLGFFENPGGALPPPPVTGAPGQTTIHGQDPSVIRVGSTYYSVESSGNNIYSRSASSVAGLAASPRTLIWASPKDMPNVWAPELVKMPAAGGSSVYAIYFASGDGAAGQRMYYTWSNSPDRNYSDPNRLNLPDDKFAVDGTAFSFNNQLWFVWSGWEGNTNIEQNLYIAKMTSPSEVTGKRFIISQAREGWERVVGNPFINEAPEAIKDPSGQLHIVYSANGSWSDQYCIADLRLRAGGDPTYVWDWYKSNGCLFGSNRGTMMAGWDPTLYVNGPGHQSFVLLDGDIATSPPAGPRFPLMFHAVPKGVTYQWANRLWYFGSFAWWGNITYSRQNVPGDNNNTGWSLKLFE